MTRFFGLILAVILLAGCSSVPLSTMWRLRDFSVKDMAAINPGELRAQIVHTDEIKINKAQLDFGITHVDGQADQYDFPFEIVDRQEETRGVFFKETISVTTLKLSPQTMEDFEGLKQTLQQFELEGEKEGRRCVSLNVAAQFESVEKGEMPDFMTFSILLKLAADEDYFTLIDEEEIDFRYEKKKALEEAERKVEEAEQKKAKEEAGEKAEEEKM